MWSTNAADCSVMTNILTAASTCVLLLPFALPSGYVNASPGDSWVASGAGRWLSFVGSVWKSTDLILSYFALVN